MIVVFRDRHDGIGTLRACDEARRLRADPSLLDTARSFLDEAMAPDEGQRAPVARRRAVLTLPAEQVAALLVEASDRGEALRETRPVYGKGLSSQDVARLIATG